jgi:uncharacterized protein (TIGR02588 family)
MKGRKNALEWTVFGVSAAILVAVAALLIIDAARGSRDEPDIEVTTGDVTARGDHFAVPVIITNRGDQTAEGLRVEIALMKDGQDVEVAEVTVAFVPRASHREAWALFRNDPRGFTLEARAIGFEKP